MPRLSAVFAREGVAVVRSKLVKVEPDGAAVRACYAGTGGDGEVRSDRMLIALGRRPNVEGLQLEHAGVAYDVHKGIRIDAYLCTSTPHIFACGDVTGPYQFTHAAGRSTRAASVRTIRCSA